MKSEKRKKPGKKVKVRQTIMLRLSEQLDYAKKIYNLDDNSWFVICLQGSQNYGIADEESDIDSKLLVIPTLDDLIFNKTPISHTLEMPDNKEHIDVKDIREYFKIVRKSNINFVEIFFTDYYIVNPKYKNTWNYLRENSEIIARINPFRAVKAMKGMAYEKYHALRHEYPSRKYYIDKYGFDPKQLSHLIRIYLFLEKFINENSYKECIVVDKHHRDYLIKMKRYGEGLSADQAEKLASIYINKIEELERSANYKNIEDEEANERLDYALETIIKRSIVLNWPF